VLKDDRNPRALAALPDEALIDAVQRQTFRCFCDAGAASGLALDRRMLAGDTADDKVAIGASGLGVMALIVAVERGWVTREATGDRLRRMLDALFRAISERFEQRSGMQISAKQLVWSCAAFISCAPARRIAAAACQVSRR